MAKTLTYSLLEAVQAKNYTKAHRLFASVMEQKLAARLNEEKRALMEGAEYQCMECGKKYSKPVDECTKCGGSDIDLAESFKPLTESEDKKVCPNCKQWSYPDKKKGYYDCGSECAKRGFAKKIQLKESRQLTEGKFRIYYADGTEEDFTGSAADVRAKVKKSTKEVEDVETIG